MTQHFMVNGNVDVMNVCVFNAHNQNNSSDEGDIQRGANPQIGYQFRRHNLDAPGGWALFRPLKPVGTVTISQAR